MPSFRCVGLAGWLLVALGCGSTAPTADAALSAAERVAIVDSVGLAVRQFVAAADPSRCTDVDAALAQYSFDQGTFLLMEDTAMVQMDSAGGRALMQRALCGTRSITATVDSIQVQVLSRTIAVAGWRFNETRVDTAGTSTRVTGLVFGPWIRDASGWRTTAAMSSHLSVDLK